MKTPKRSNAEMVACVTVVTDLKGRKFASMLRLLLLRSSYSLRFNQLNCSLESMIQLDRIPVDLFIVTQMEYSK